LLEGESPRRVGEAQAFVETNLCSKFARNVNGPVIAVHIHHNDLVNPGMNGP
jgi:hypothetical protein